jgi:hypothetical protein
MISDGESILSPEEAMDLESPDDPLRLAHDRERKINELNRIWARMAEYEPLVPSNKGKGKRRRRHSSEEDDTRIEENLTEIERLRDFYAKSFRDYQDWMRDAKVKFMLYPVIFKSQNRRVLYAA